MHIATIQKNGIETIEVAFKEFEGVTLKPDQIRELREALKKAEAAAGEMPQTP
ncbi:MAG: hypothetical protein ACREXX_05110 [Gammaproteobacteria bacterium]